MLKQPRSAGRQRRQVDSEPWRRCHCCQPRWAEAVLTMELPVLLLVALAVVVVTWSPSACLAQVASVLASLVAESA